MSPQIEAAIRPALSRMSSVGSLAGSAVRDALSTLAGPVEDAAPKGSPERARSPDGKEVPERFKPMQRMASWEAAAYGRLH
jgi:hypothetical protein